MRGRISHQDCRACAQDPLHPCMLPADLLELMRVDYGDEDREPDPDAFTPSRLQGCLRAAVLHGTNDWYVDIKHAYPLTRGHMVHALMEGSTYPGVFLSLREQRLSTVVDTKYGPQRFTGKPDLVVITSVEHTLRGDIYHAKVVDYKSKNEIGHDLTQAQREHEIQINLYAWLVGKSLLPHVTQEDSARPSVVVVDEVEIVYCDMKKVRRFTSAGPLSTDGKMLTRRPPTYAPLALAPLELKDPEWCEHYIKRRVEWMIAAKETLPPVLGPDDAWKCPRCPVRDVCAREARQRGEPEPAM